MNRNDDSLEARLRREAADERPAFSRELHSRMMNQISAERSARKWRWPALAAAAAIVLGVTFYLLNEPLTPERAEVVQTTEGISSEPLVIPDLSVNVGGIISAQLWPPGVGLELPVDLGGKATANESQSPAIQKEPQGAPDWILAQLDEPSNSAQAALASALPPEVRVLIAFATSQR